MPLGHRRVAIKGSQCEPTDPQAPARSEGEVTSRRLDEDSALWTNKRLMGFMKRGSISNASRASPPAFVYGCKELSARDQYFLPCAFLYHS